MTFKGVQVSHLKQLVSSPQYQTLLWTLNEIDRKATEAGTIGNNEFETLNLAIRRDERRNLIKEIIDTIEGGASQSNL